jgi:hypothetical protein
MVIIDRPYSCRFSRRLTIVVDYFHNIPANVSTVADLLNMKGISWGTYQEHMPYPGFQGFNYSNQETYANDYMRKHNPLVSFDSISNNDTALSLIKNFTSFYNDLHKKVLPQWAFITPSTSPLLPNSHLLSFNNLKQTCPTTATTPTSHTAPSGSAASYPTS